MFVRYCGTTFPPELSSTRNELFIKFFSDDTTTRPGFLISYESVRDCSLSPCKEGEGDCASDSDCADSLVCGQGNCADNTWQQCCTLACKNDSTCSNQECNTDTNLCRVDSYSTDWSYCSQNSPCNKEEGDCDHHLDCVGGLLCGVDNCAGGSKYLDCCTGTSII